ncbi:hypothetical protein RF11_14286 [Thelohanellus kitauei]|uniref:Uncharacterized protein n=1 Tax=Thelohanellus kitauei TaxID=669202 RepID=A0A0C2M4K3_THEKT|nr:hypothetical protein RF11_14286 [Thelohanellus kitauei]
MSVNGRELKFGYYILVQVCFPRTTFKRVRRDGQTPGNWQVKLRQYKYDVSLKENIIKDIDMIVQEELNAFFIPTKNSKYEIKYSKHSENETGPEGALQGPFV